MHIKEKNLECLLVHIAVQRFPRVQFTVATVEPR